MVEKYTLADAQALIEQLKALENGRSFEQKLDPRGIEAFAGSDPTFTIRELSQVTILHQDGFYHFNWGNSHAQEPYGQYSISESLKFSAWRIPCTPNYFEKVGISLVNDLKGLRVNFFPAPIPIFKSW